MKETEAIVGKAPRLGIHTPKCHAAVRPCGSFSERNIWGTQFELKSLSRCVEGVIVWWGVREVGVGMSR